MKSFLLSVSIVGLFLTSVAFAPALAWTTAAAAHAAETHVYTYTVYAHSLPNGDFGHHTIVIVATNDQEAEIKVQTYLANWKVTQHYNSKHAKLISKN